jgi:DNA-binding beta-propeller fold protein YncE
MRPAISFMLSAERTIASRSFVNRSNGTLSVIAGSPLTAGSAPVAILANPRDECVHVLSAVNSTLTTYRIDTETGQLTQTGQSQTGFQPSALAVSLTGGFIYTANAGDGTISEFAFDQQSGTSRSLAGSPIPTGMNPLGIALDPEARFAYVANFNSNEIWGYSVAADGTLHQLDGPKALAAPRPKALTIAPNQRVLYVTNVEANVVTGYAIANDGTLQPLLR